MENKPMGRTDKKIAAILQDPAASYWLKNALKSALDRDCVDAANDAEVLSRLLSDRAVDAATFAASEDR